MHRHANRRGAAVIARTARNGVITYSIKYVDAAGEQGWERLGTDVEGWTRQKARAVLDDRLSDVRREGLTRPSSTTVADVARDWIATYPAAKGLKHSTRTGYFGIVGNYVIPYLGDLLIADRLGDPLSPATVNRHLNVLSLVVRSARKRKLMRDNPVELVDRPRERRRRWRILMPAEVQRVQTAFA